MPITNTTIVHISSGRGPVECERAVLLFADYLENSLRSLSAPPRLMRTVEAGGQRAGASSHMSIRLACDSPAMERAALDLIAPFIGTVQWICPSPYRPGHQRKNWYIQVSTEIPPSDDGSAAKLKAADVRYETARSSGKGGQHVNKTETAVRAVHLPTGLTAVARDERSQYRNKAIALARLEALLANQDAQERQDRKAGVRRQHDRLERGNAAATFTGLEFKLAKQNGKETT